MIRPRDPSGGAGLDILYVGRLALEAGGASRTCAEILVGLARAGCRVRALSPGTAESARRPEPFAGLHPALSVTRFRMPYLEAYAFEPAPDEYRALQRDAVARLLPGMITQRRPDVILIGRESDVWSVPDLARAHGVPSVAIAHGVVLAVLDGRFPAPLGQALLAECGKLDLIIACAEHMATRLRACNLVPVVAIPNAINLTRFRPGRRSRTLLRRLRIDDEAVIVLHVSNLRPVKRPLDVAEAAAKALRRDPRLRYVVVGGDPGRTAMEDACRILGVHDRFRFVGRVSHSRVPAFMRLADMVVMTSESEGRARVYLEAQACGRVLLASDIPAAREVIVPGETGLLFRLQDTDALAAAILLAADDPALRHRIGRAARRWASAHYQLADAVSAYGTTLGALARRARLEAGALQGRSGAAAADGPKRAGRAGDMPRPSSEAPRRGRP